MKFDIVVGNPPYEYKGAGTLHLKIMKTVLDFCTDKLTFIMPSKPITQQLDREGNWYKMFKSAVCTDVTTVKKGTFANTNMDDTAIYYIDRKPGAIFSDKFEVDNKIYNAINNEAHKLFIDKLSKIKSYKIYANLHDATEPSIQRAKKSIKDGYYYLNVNRANGLCGGKLISGTLVDIGILTAQEELKFLETRTEVLNIIKCPTKEYGENLKNLMINGKVLRYGLWLTQTNQNIYTAQFRYVPDVDYTTIDTDEKLLKVCGFTSDEIVQVMKYLNDFDFSQNRNELVRGTKEEPDSSPSGSVSSKTVLDN